MTAKPVDAPPGIPGTILWGTVGGLLMALLVATFLKMDLALAGHYYHVETGDPGVGRSFPSGHAAMGYVLLVGCIVSVDDTMVAANCSWCCRAQLWDIARLGAYRPGLRGTYKSDHRLPATDVFFAADSQSV